MKVVLRLALFLPVNLGEYQYGGGYMGKTKTHEQFIDEIYTKYGDEYTVISEYKSSKSNIVLKHNDCGNEFTRIAGNVLLRKVQCKCEKSSPVKWTKELFLENLSDEFELLSEYEGSKKKALFKHKECGKEWETTPYMFILGYGCRSCSLKNANTGYSQEEFESKVKQVLGEDYAVSGKYLGIKENIEITHKSCGTVFDNLADRILNKGVGCPQCSERKRWDTGSFKEYVADESNGEYELISPYTKMHDKHTFLHIACGNTYQSEANSFKEGNRCPTCATIALKKPLEVFIEEIKNTHGLEYIIEANYVDTATKITVKHVKCGNIFQTMPQTLRRGSGCPKCAREFVVAKANEATRHTHEMFVDYVEQNGHGEYDVVSEYHGSNTHIDLKHIVCGSTYSTLPAYFKSGTRCPNCYESSGEAMVRQYLENNCYAYEKEFKFVDCRNIYKLRFDFCVFDSIGNISFLIEFDGKQHFEQIGFFGEKHFSRTQQNDSIKNEYCKTNGIKLIRIPYWEFDNGTIHQFIDNELQKLGLLKIAN